MKVTGLVVGNLGTNCYILKQEDCSDCIVVDPGEDADRIIRMLEKLEAKPVAVMLTHGHFDHIGAADAIRERYGAQVILGRAEEELIRDEELNCSTQFGRHCHAVIDRYLEDGELFEVAQIRLKALATPGHTIGGMCFYVEEAGILLSGDTLFRESIGRTDFPTGNMEELLSSITQRLMLLPDDTKVYPGHGFSTTIGHEREYNSFINGDY